MFFLFIEEAVILQTSKPLLTKMCYNLFGRGYEEDKIFSIEDEDRVVQKFLLKE